MKSFLKFFAIIYIPIIIILLWVFSYSAARMTESGKNELLAEMRNMWKIVSQFENRSVFNLAAHHKVENISRETTLRITLIRPDGIVVDDSYLRPGEIPKMENHATRPEVAGALVSGKGHSVRFSHTVKQEMMYYASKLKNGMILRVAYPMTYVARIQSEWRHHVILSLIFLLIAIGIIALYLAKRLAYPLQQLDEIVREVESGKEQVHFPDFTDPTMARVSGLIYRIYHSMLKNQQAVRNERSRLHEILSTMEESILLLDERNRVMLFNRNAEKHLGTPLEKGKNIMDQIDDVSALALVRTILQSDETYFPRINRENRYFEVYVRTVAKGTLIVMHDITEQGRYEVFKSELIGNITHELKTPVASIMGYAETLISTPGISPEDTERFHGIILNQSRRLNDIIMDLLELHRLENTETPTVNDELSVTSLTEELKSRYRNCGKKLRFSGTEINIMVKWQHLESLLCNLIDNAVRYSEGETVSVRFFHTGKAVTISVSDEGPAIPPNERERIFERFYTISKSRNRQKGGTGLGLSIVKHIVSIYKGNIQLKENESGGNTFTVTLFEQPQVTGKM